MDMQAKRFEALELIVKATDAKDLNQLVHMFSVLIEQKRAAQCRSFRKGEKVTFKTKTGKTMQGVVQKVNRKTVSVLTDVGSSWRVSGSLLQKAA